MKGFFFWLKKEKGPGRCERLRPKSLFPGRLVREKGKTTIMQDYTTIAKHFHTLGLNVIPVIPGEKRPAISWAQYQDERQDIAEVEAMKWEGSLAAIDGPGSIRCFDFDGLAYIGEVNELLDQLGLPHTYEWVVKSGGGYHVWFRSEGELPGGKNILVGKGFPGVFKQLELRWFGHCTLLPTSSHPTNPNGYRCVHCDLPTNPPACVPVERVLEGFNYLIDTSGELRETNDGGVADAEERPLATWESGPWATKALEDELKQVREAEEGTRNTTLFKAACSLGEFVGGGYLDEDLVRTELMDAAQKAGLEQKEILPSIQSGLQRGKQNPREHRAGVGRGGQAGIDDEELLQFEADDNGNAEAVKALYGNIILHTDSHGWLVYNGKFWEQDAAEVKRKVIETLKRRRVAAVKKGRHEDIVMAATPNDYRVRGCLSLLSAIQSANIREFDNNPDQINAQNGVVDLRTGEVIPHHHSQRFTYAAPCNLNPNADTSTWKNFLKGSIRNGDEMIDFVQMALGYTLTGHVSDECMFYVYGKPRAGKGTLFEGMQAILGTPLAATTPYSTFAQKRDGDSQNFDLAPLRPARMVVATETNKGERFNSGFTKEITGGGSIRCAFKHKDQFEYKVGFKIWISSNNMLNADPDDSALWTRMRVIEFPHSRSEDEADPEVKKRLKAYLEGLFLFVVQGAMKWYQQGRLPNPEIAKQTKAEHRLAVDSVAQWIEDACELDTDYILPATSARHSYERWCEENGFTPKQSRGFNESLREKGLTPGAQRKVSGQNCKCILGIRLAQRSGESVDDGRYDLHLPELTIASSW